jgi:hypothetical protein
VRLNRVPLTLLALVTAAVMLSSPAGALGAKKKGKKPKLGPVVTVTETLAVSSEFVTATAGCPAGTNLVGGGHRVAPVTQTGSTFASAAHRTGRASWSVTAVSFTMGGGTVTAEAYCRRGAPQLVEATAATTLPPATGPFSFGNGTSSATCPGNLKAVAGGYSGAVVVDPGYEGPFVHSSQRDPSGRGWVLTALNTAQEPENGVLTARVLCSERGRVQVASPPVPATGVETPAEADSPRCPKPKKKGKKKGKKQSQKAKVKKKKKKKKKVMLSGGYVTPTPSLTLNPANSRGVFPTESRLEGPIWRAAGTSVGSAPGDSSIQALGYCG